MKIKKLDYLGLDHTAVAKKFEGDLKFVNYMNLNLTTGQNKVCAVYKAASPNRKKGHKTYMAIYQVNDPVLFTKKLYVIGRDPEELIEDRYHKGILCLVCNTVVISLSRHDYVTCDCSNKAMADGGRDYLRSGGRSLDKIEQVEVDLLTDTIKTPIKKYKRK